MAADRSTDRLRAGLQVRDSAGEPVGQIRDVWADVGVSESWGSTGSVGIEGNEAADPAQFAYSEAMPGEGESYFCVVLPDGGDLYVPFSYVAGVRDDVAILSITADDLLQLRWDLRPDFLHEGKPTQGISEGGGELRE
jgi:hypothetical protein